MVYKEKSRTNSSVFLTWSIRTPLFMSTPLGTAVYPYNNQAARQTFARLRDFFSFFIVPYYLWAVSEAIRRPRAGCAWEKPSGWLETAGPNKNRRQPFTEDWPKSRGILRQPSEAIMADWSSDPQGRVPLTYGLSQFGKHLRRRGQVAIDVLWGVSQTGRRADQFSGICNPAHGWPGISIGPGGTYRPVVARFHSGYNPGFVCCQGPAHRP